MAAHLGSAGATLTVRILLLNERDPEHPRAGGAEVHVAEVARRMEPLGFETTQLACGFPGAPERAELPGLRVERLGRIRFYYPRAIARTARATARGEFDVVVEHLNKLPFCASTYARAPVIAVSHHLFGESAFLQAAWPVAATVVALERIIPRVYRNVPVLAVSESSRRDLVDRGLDPAHIGLLPNGLVMPAREPTPVAERPLRVVYLGRLARYKRIDRLLRAIAALAPRFPTLELVLVGRGEERHALERLARRLGIAERTRFTGFVADAVRDEEVAAARVAVCPSVKEGWGLTVIESNALGVPVIATDAPGLRDAVKHGVTGLLLPDAPEPLFSESLAGVLAGLLEDTSRLEALAREARTWAARFDWESSARIMADTVRATLEQ